MIAVAFKPRTMNALSALRIGIDATDIGITSGERGGVYQYILHLHHHVAAVSPDSDLRPMFALPHYRHSRAIRQFVAVQGCANVISRLCPSPALIAAASLPKIAGDAAISVDPYDVDSIHRVPARMIEDDALRDTLARKALANVARFSWENWAEQVADVYRKALP